MLLDVDVRDFEKMARAGFFWSVRLRAQTMTTVQQRCRSLGLVPVSATVFRLGEAAYPAATDIYYNVMRFPSGFWLVRQN